MAPRRGADKGGKGGAGSGGTEYQFPLRDADGRISVLVEMAATPGVSAVAAAANVRAIDLSGFETDEEFQPVPLRAGGGLGLMAAASPTTYIVRGRVQDEAAIEELRRHPATLGVWGDTAIAPFPIADVQVPAAGPAAGVCPIPPCDCTPTVPHGTIADVANYVGASNLWAAGAPAWSWASSTAGSRRRDGRSRRVRRPGGFHGWWTAGRRPTGAPKPAGGASTGT